MRTLALSELPSSGGLQKTKMGPTRIGVGGWSLSHTSSRETPKSCFGFVGGGAGHWLSSRVLELRQKAQFLTELLLTVFWPEPKEEERLLLIVV